MAKNSSKKMKNNLNNLQRQWKKENALIIPFATTGLYNGEKEQLITRIGKPLDISSMELEDANKLLRQTMIKLMQKSE